MGPGHLPRGAHLSPPPSAVSRPRSSPDDLKALTRNVNRLNESFRDLQLRLLQAPLQADLTEQVWKVQDALQNQSDSLLALAGAVQRLEGALWGLQAQAAQAEQAVALLRDRTGQQSDAAQLELYQLQVESNRTQLLLRRHAGLLDGLARRVGGLGEELADVGGALRGLNHSLSYDVALHSTRLQDLQVLVSNASEDARRMRLVHMGMELQLKQELAVLNTVTEDLRLKDWEHSIALRNISLAKGSRLPPPHLLGPSSWGPLPLPQGLGRPLLLPQSTCHWEHSNASARSCPRGPWKFLPKWPVPIPQPVQVSPLEDLTSLLPPREDTRGPHPPKAEECPRVANGGPGSQSLGVPAGASQHFWLWKEQRGLATGLMLELQ